jgi:hypothetical protein
MNNCTKLHLEYFRHFDENLVDTRQNGGDIGFYHTKTDDKYGVWTTF